MKVMIIRRPVKDCTECLFRILSISTPPHNWCDNVGDPNKPDFARAIPDVSTIPEWCPLPDIARNGEVRE
jgi:hypothetical protein